MASASCSHWANSLSVCPCAQAPDLPLVLALACALVLALGRAEALCGLTGPADCCSCSSFFCTAPTFASVPPLGPIDRRSCAVADSSAQLSSGSLGQLPVALWLALSLAGSTLAIGLGGLLFLGGQLKKVVVNEPLVCLFAVAGDHENLLDCRSGLADQFEARFLKVLKFQMGLGLLR